MGLRFFSIANLAIAGGGKQEVELHDFLFMFMTVNQGDLRNLLLHVRCLMNFQEMTHQFAWDHKDDMELWPPKPTLYFAKPGQVCCYWWHKVHVGFVKVRALLPVKRFQFQVQGWQLFLVACTLDEEQTCCFLKNGGTWARIWKGETTLAVSDVYVKIDTV